VKTYQELLLDFREAKSRVERARAEWDNQLPAEGVRLSSHPQLRPAHEEIVAAQAQESAAREALIDYRGD
jgi:hypothetical protein